MSLKVPRKLALAALIAICSCILLIKARNLLLFIAADVKDPLFVRALLAAGADPDREFAGNTAITKALLKGDLRTAKLLLRSSVMLSQSDPHRRTALHLVIVHPLAGFLSPPVYGRLPLPTQLLQWGANPYQTDQNGLNTLDLAVAQGPFWSRQLDLLLALGVDPNRRDLHGNTALDFALQTEVDRRVVKDLLRHNARPSCAKLDSERDALIEAVGDEISVIRGECIQ